MRDQQAAAVPGGVIPKPISGSATRVFTTFGRAPITAICGFVWSALIHPLASALSFLGLQSFFKILFQLRDVPASSPASTKGFGAPAFCRDTFSPVARRSGSPRAAPLRCAH